jgi:sugar phosphate isomerase/epimerase
MMPVLRSGLCSVTFRELPADEIIDLAADAQLSAVEWGADVHVRPGDIDEAERVRRRCADHGLECPSYGSYFAATQSRVEELDDVAATAEALGASVIRVWSPYGVGPGADRGAVETIARALGDACDRVAPRGLTLALEFHPDTLTETADSARALIAAIDRPNLRTYWQPRPGATAEHAFHELTRVLPLLAHLHVFAWRPDSSRLPLVEHEELWRKALSTVASAADANERVAYLEFVADDDPAAFAADAKTLREWIESM